MIEVNNTIRVVGSTWFGSDDRGLVIDGKPVSRPITLEVIGEPHSLEEAARFRGGIVSEITGPKDRRTGADRTRRPRCDRIATRVARESVRSPCAPAANPSMTLRA